MDDLDAVLAVGHRTWPATYEGIAGADYVQAGLAKWWSAEATSPAIRQGRLTVAEVDGEVSAWPAWGARRTTWSCGGSTSCPSTTARASGRRCWQRCWRRPHGTVPEIRLSYTEGNTPAAHFYRSSGFVETHHEAGGGGVPDQVWMSRRVPRRAAAAEGPTRPTVRHAPATAPADPEGVQ